MTSFLYGFRLLSVIVMACGSVHGSTTQDPKGETAEAVKAAEDVAKAWLGLLDKGQTGTTWDEAATTSKIAVTKEAWDKGVRQARAPLEPLGARERTLAEFRTELPNTPPGRFVVLQYRTAAAGQKHAIETIIMMLDGERGWRVSLYLIRPDQ
jgi:hypothetical protein